MATKAKNLALAAASVDDAGNITADLIDSIDSLQFLRSDQADTLNGDLTVAGGITARNADYENALKINRNLDVASVGAAGVKMKFGAINNGVDVYPVEIAGIVDTDGGAGWLDINLDGSNKFKIHNNGTVSVPNGNVGIGTTSPGSSLDIKKKVSTSEDMIRFMNYNSNTDAMAAFGFDQSDDTLFIRNDQDYATGGIQFKTGSTPSTKMFIRTDGNVGIGTTDPGSKLQVNGQIHSDNTIAGGSNTLYVSTKKDYSVSTGTVERARLALSLSENGYTVDQREFGVVSAKSDSDGSSSSGTMFFETRSTGVVAPRITLNATSMSIDTDKMKFPTRTTDPTGVTAGEAYFNTSSNSLRIFNGQTWKDGASVPVYVPYALDFFNDGSGISLLKFDGSIADDSGNSTFNSGGSYSTGATGSSGQCIDFGSTNNGSYVGINNRSPRSASAGGWTWSFWMYYYGSTFNDHGFFGTNSSDSTNGFLFHCHAGSSEFYIIHNQGDNVTNIPVSNPQSWNHFLASYGEDNKLKVYLNGQNVGEGAITGSYPSSFGNVTVFVGRDRCCEDTMRYTNGAFDHVRIFDKPVTAAEALALYEEFTL